MIKPISVSRPLLRSLFQTLNSPSSNTASLLSSSSSCSGRILSAPPIWVPSAPYSQDSNGEKEDRYELVSLFNRDPTSPPRLFVVQPRLRPDAFLQAKLNEALCLANSLEEQRDGYFDIDFFDKEIPSHIVVQNPSVRGHKTRADTYFGPGTVGNVKIQLNLVESKGEVDAVFVNTILSGIQQRNLERAWNKPVLDRVGLIIEIFNAHAYTKEAKLQAELAALTYKKTRLVRVRGPDGRYTFGGAGEAEVVSARGRGSGGRGFISGAGETELQLQRRRILERRRILLSQIEEVRRTRALQRASRKRHGGSDGQGLATVAVVGYTNAGKSTLVSALSNSDLYSDSRLFATVDPRLRSVVLPSGRKVLLSDTVGFISDLPVQLVEAFHATLEEVVEADLLVHVLDCTAPNLDEHRSTVLSVLEQLGVSKEKLLNMIEVWNKIDYQEEDMGVNEYLDDGEASEEEEEMACEESQSAENNETFISSGANDNAASVLSAETNQNVVSNIEAGQLYDDHPSDNAYEESAADLEATDDQEDDYSDGWLASEDDLNPWSDEDVCSVPLMSTDNQQSECSKGWRSEKGLLSQDQSGPHVKTSALMGVGLQELLELIDERLNNQDKKLKAQNVVERSIFDRKWRPPREEEAGIAVEQ
ncbi:GTPase [Parasponia andersonii]|uniref:GTPase n=1 Tax=Parasponia andersonii TaxID=3476 RepID=A0A2P5A772_PARAD|nr:GTPase [Parasponia andersonii]